MPEWNAYDHIDHFLRFGWPGFADKQRCAAERLAKAIDLAQITHVFDIGCGSGDILLHLSQMQTAPAYLGIDISSKQIERANARLSQLRPTPRLAFQNCSFADLQLPAGACHTTLILFVGNVLPHLGAAALREWLKKNKTASPHFILFDFAKGWRNLLDRASLEDNCGPICVTKVKGLTVYAHMSTSLGPRNVDRGMVLQIFRAGVHVGSQAVFMVQYADTPDTYFDVLSNYGYRVEQLPALECGWGTKDLYLATLEGRPVVIDWPQPSHFTQFLLNDIWYKVLCDIWTECKPEEHLTFNDLTLYPAAVLPFEHDHDEHGVLRIGDVWARYIPKTHADKATAYSPLFSAWLRLVDRHTTGKDLPPEGAAKGESMPPYSPALFDVLLGDVPSAFIRQIKDVPLRLATNERDEKVTELEAMWFERKPGSELGYFVMPLYVMGMPMYCIITKGLPATTPFGTVMAVLRHERDRLAVVFEEKLLSWGWRRFLREALAKTKDATLLQRILDGVHERPWKSWLDTVPGMNIYGDARVANEWSRLCDFHRRCLAFVTSSVHEQISEVCRESAFFTTVADRGKGHERDVASSRCRSGDSG